MYSVLGKILSNLGYPDRVPSLAFEIDMSFFLRLISRSSEKAASVCLILVEELFCTLSSSFSELALKVASSRFFCVRLTSVSVGYSTKSIQVSVFLRSLLYVMISFFALTLGAYGQRPCFLEQNQPSFLFYRCGWNMFYSKQKATNPSTPKVSQPL